MPLDDSFVQARRTARKALFVPKAQRVKRSSIKELAQQLGLEKDALKKILLTMPEFSVILKP